MADFTPATLVGSCDMAGTADLAQSTPTGPFPMTVTDTRNGKGAAAMLRAKYWR